MKLLIFWCFRLFSYKINEKQLSDGMFLNVAGWQWTMFSLFQEDSQQGNDCVEQKEERINDEQSLLIENN